MYVYNTMTKKKEKFIPIKKDCVSIYLCGPTVYDYIHIGNARPICIFDVLRRYLEKIGYKVTFVQNFTDIDDKIINKSIKEGVGYSDISEKYIKEYDIDAKGLGIKDASFRPKATDNMDKILDMISSLVEKKFAYVLTDGSVYFRTRLFKEYGKLSHQSLDDLKSGARIKIDEEKEDPLDFALWKSSKEGEPFWLSPWGSGRPGWHIECSAMATGYLGETIDIHCGGQDLVFPHHENEIAQSECCSGKKFANYWMHNGYISINSEKMSKSKGNFFTVRDIAKKYGYETIRYLMISSHYRNQINYDDKIMEQSKASLKRLWNFKQDLEFIVKDTKNISTENKFNVEKYKNKFYNAMDDDLNTSDALAAIFEMIRDFNKQKSEFGVPCIDDVKKTIKFFNEFTDIFGILSEEKYSMEIDKDGIEDLINLRIKAKKDKNWAEADRIRDLLKSKNIILEDTPEGIRWKIKKD